MSISPDIPTFDIGPSISTETHHEIEKLLLVHKPKKAKTANVELDITLTDDKPVFHTLRRIPFADYGKIDTNRQMG